MELCSMLYGNLDGRGLGRECRHVDVWLGPFAVHLKLPQHCLLISYISIQNQKFEKQKKRKFVSFSSLTVYNPGNIHPLSPWRLSPERKLLSYYISQCTSRLCFGLTAEMERKALSLWQEFSDIRTHLVVLGSRIPENTLLLHSLRPNIVSE